MSGPRSYEGEAIRVTFDASRCLHAAECVRGLPAVFDPDSRPWIDPAGAGPDEIAAVVRRCPTGALQYSRLDDEAREESVSSTTITVTPNGPLYARGDLDLLDGDHRPIRRETRVALCRCGASANKPYCDGSHVQAGFEAPARLGQGRLKPRDAQTPERLTVRLRRDGPLLLDGPLRLTAGPSESIEGCGGALCRCGASQRKPFCDGTHKSIGFETDDPVGR